MAKMKTEFELQRWYRNKRGGYDLKIDPKIKMKIYPKTKSASGKTIPVRLYIRDGFREKVIMGKELRLLATNILKSLKSKKLKTK